jgi:hypothetical protein
MKYIIGILILIFSFSSSSIPQISKDTASLPKIIASNYGVNAFAGVTSISFTFNVKNEKMNTNRNWKWETKTGLVEYYGPDQNGKDTTISYNRNKIDSNNKFFTFVDKRFINDSYWLLFPFHLIWDDNVSIKDLGMKDCPISHTKARSLIVQYQNNVGYTPNDAFVLFLDKNNMIKEWIYRPGGSEEKERPSTWEGNKNFDGITISTDHNGPGKKFRVWFTDIKVKSTHK